LFLLTSSLRDNIPFLDSIRLEFEVGLFISLLGLKKFLFELFAPYSTGLAAGL